ncbi:MAG TPA: protein kinase [Thermoanaerobaculia bacterium]|nr:protein kinase [Thermoanaerobaculia bacterium]
MTLAAGSRLGPYEIVSTLGAGGMGEVYKARDTRLERTVAIKVLASHLVSSADVRQRFEREAKTISQLSHPHICAVHDVGRQGETEYLVMEYLEGETLAERLQSGALPLEQTLRYGIQIADALDKAHRQGIVHRDLKPGNVMLTPSGVKLLDFGLAKVMSPAAPQPLTELPTQQALTQEGTIMGTVQYMAPEQLEGKEADARTDVFAFGATLFEMATGTKAFSAATQASLIGAILRDDPPPISRLQPIVPRALDRVVATCLAKEPENRWQTARDVALQLDWIRQERSSVEPVTAAPPRRRRLAVVPWAFAAVGLAVAAFALTSASRQRLRPRTTRAYLLPPPNTTFHLIGANVAPPAVSPDGRRIAFGARDADGSIRLWVRELEALEAYAVPGGEGALFPFWSPDSRSIAFFAKGKLKVVEATPSPPAPRDLADVVEPRGGTWGEDGTILFVPENLSPLMRVAAAGGTPEPATRLDRAAGETAHRWPSFLPGGRRFLYEIRRAGGDPNAPGMTFASFVGSLEGGEKRAVLSEGRATTYVPPGYLVFRRANSLMAVSCDSRSLSFRGDPVVLAESSEAFAATGVSLFSVSKDLLVYPPRIAATLTRLVWLDRSGKELSTVGPAERVTNFALSPDGRRAVTVQIEEGSPPDLWLFDTEVGRGIRLTRDGAAQTLPVFSSDGARIFLSAYSRGPWNLWEITPQGRDLKPFLESDSSKSANDVSPDGRYLLYREFNRGTRGDLKVVSLTGERRPRAFIATVDEETNGDFSPDGRWVAYTSDESGRKEVYVASFPDPTLRFRVSGEGGSQPRWSRDGKEIFYVRSGQLMAAVVGRRGGDLVFGESRALFPLRLSTQVDPAFDSVTNYDVAPDGRFLANLRAGEDAPTPLVLVENWRETLKK